MSDRDWRYDQVDGAPSDLEPEPFTPLGSTAAPCPRTRRLTLWTLCKLAASALLRHDRQNAELSQPAGRDLEPIPNALAIASARTDRDLDETKTKENHFAAAVFQDATFLHAILPFALGLSQRHGEPLSLLCVAIDRLSGIHELLGRDCADRAVRNVGAHIAAMLRDSDIVARLDDDRIIVVLPRALIPDAWNLARQICRTVATTPALLAELPVLTVSIGVAEFPACANNVYALLDAADHALSMARNQGRNQAVAATTLNPTDPVNQARCAIGLGAGDRSRLHLLKASPGSLGPPPMAWNLK